MLLNLEVPPNDARDLRELAGAVLGLFALALFLSCIFALIVRKISSAPQASLATSVWWDVLRADRVPAGKVPYALITMDDGETVEGVLETYTWQSDSSQYRDIALRSPIRYPAGKGMYKNTRYDHLVIAGSEIKQIAVQHTVM